MQEAIGQLQWRAIDSGVMNDPIDIDVNAAKTVAAVAIPIRRRRHRRYFEAGDDAPRRDRPGDRRHARRRGGRRDGTHGAIGGSTRR